jgi:hypothetical protein
MDQKMQTLYYLIHATKHPLGRIKMKESMKRIGAGGIFAYLGPQDKMTRLQLPLLATNLDELKSLLVERFSGQSITFDDTQILTCMETELVESDYREAIRQLRREGAATVLPVTSKTQRGIAGKDKITF